jgi:pyruvate dehydrogenase E2 component (dihydrolipoamide acetyltransferase)
MPLVIQMPKLGHAMTEGTVLKWHKHAGDNVRAGEAVLTVETDKAEVEIESPAAGVLARVIADEGTVVGVGLPLGEVLRDGETATDSRVAAKPAEAASQPTAIAASPAPANSNSRGRIVASPRAKRIAAEGGIDLAGISGSGPDGLITEDDVRRAGAAAPAPAKVEQPAASDGGLVPARREKLTRVQLVGARNVTASWTSVPHFVQMVRVDMSRARAARQALNSAGGKITVTDIVLAATVLALKENLFVNSSYHDGERLIYDEVNLGIAVDTPDGLVVPVIHHAQALDVAALSARAVDLAERARSKKLRPADLEDATFTVSNLGAYGVENGTPVIFAPQAALMFVGGIHDEVLAIDGRAEVRPAMQIAIAYDHRGIDGATASRFTTRVKALLESPDFLGASAKAEAPAPSRHREVTVDAVGDSLKAAVRYGALRWSLSADDDTAPDPVSSFLGALGGCLLMSLRVAARARKIQVGRTSVTARANEKGHVKEINVELQVESGADTEQLQRLVEVAERGCHIRAMIRDDVAVSLKVTKL